MASETEPRLRWLLVDLNSYFASVEQELRPELRGRPVAVVPVMADTTCAIAARYEAKVFGVRTGRRVGDAKRMCPGIMLVEARHDVYVDYPNRIFEAVERCVPVAAVLSIDEMASSLIGRHERMHRTLKQDLHPAPDWRSQQRELDRFRQDFNQVRPHEALDMQTPASVYLPSPRPYPARVPEVEYPDTMEVRTIRSHGHFRWKKKDIFLTEVLWGEPIGLLPLGDNLFNIYFAHLPLAGFDATRGKLVPLTNAGWPENKNLPDKEKVSGMCPV
jgi:hypothetical protein